MWAAFIHNIADAIASIGVIIAGLLIIYFGWNLADPIIALVISAYVIHQGIAGRKPAIRVLTDAAPQEVTTGDAKRAIESIEGVHSAHHVHLRMLDEEHASLTAHVVIADGAAGASRSLTDLAGVKSAIKAQLEQDFGIAHVTLEFETPADSASHGAGCGERGEHA